MIRAVYELEPAGSAAALAEEVTVGMPGGRAAVRGRVVADEAGRAVVDFHEDNWGRNLPMLVAALAAGEASETRAFTRCRLVGLELPERWLPGPSRAAPARWAVGAIVKPSLGLAPAEVADVVTRLVAGGAELVKDDELLGDPPWCPLEARVEAVAAALAGVGSPPAVYCANVTGASTTLVDRARRAVDLGATGIMVNAFAQGIDGVLALREAGLGVPLFAHRVGSGPLARNERFGASGAVLAGLTRLAGADYVQVGAFSGKLFDADHEVRAQLEVVRAPRPDAAVPVAVLGGGIGPDNARAQAEAAGGTGLLILLGSRAYSHPRGVEAGVAATCRALR